MRVIVPGELDANGVRLSKALIEKCAAEPDDLVLDLSGVTRLDSSGLGLLVYAQKRKCEHGHGFSICNAAGQPLKLLAAFDLLHVFRHAADGEAAK